MHAITFEQFLHHTNAEEIVVSKMKEAGPRIYRINYDRRIKYCKVLYNKFYDVKLRKTVFKYGLVLKPMPNSFKAKFLQFAEQNNNEGDYNSSVITENTSEPLEHEIQNKLRPLEEKYKNDLPSTSSAFRHKPRIISPSEKNKTQTKTNLQQQKPNLKRDMTSPKHTFKIPKSKSVSKRRKSLEKQKFCKEQKSPKITKYFTNTLNINVDEEMNPEQIKELRKRISDPQKVEPQSKRPKISPVKKTDTKSEPDIIQNQIGPKSSKTSCKTRNIKKQPKKNKTKYDGKNNSMSKEATTKCRMRLYSDDFASDDCDINTNNSIINLISGESRPQAGPERKFENNSSPSKSALPKRNRTEDYGKTSNSITKKILEEKSHEKRTGYNKNEIELWMTEGQKALQDNEGNNKNACTEVRPNKHNTFREDVFVGDKLQTIKTHPDKVKKYIKYLLKFEIQMRKGINLEATVVSETSRAKILSAFEKIKYEDYKNLISVKTNTSQGELEENIKNLYTAFIRNEKPWPAVHIELEKLRSFLHSKGIKGYIPLKNIPPRILSFDEVLEKTNIKECISLNCSKPPESYKELLSLCKKEYEKCCCIGIWTEELKLNDKKEESGSSQEMSIELFTEPSMPKSPLKIDMDSGNIQQNVTQKESQIVQNLNNNISNSIATKNVSKNEQNESADSKNPAKPSSTNPKKSGTYGPKSRRKHSSKIDDDLEILINHICGDDDQQPLMKTAEPIDTQELNRILAHSQTEPSSDNQKEIPHSKRWNSAVTAVCTKSTNGSQGVSHSERGNSADIAVCTDFVTKSLPKVANNNQKDITKQTHESLVKTKQRSDVASPPAGDLIPPSPNIFGCTDETNTKCCNIQMANNNFKTPPKLASKETTLPSSEMDGFISKTNDNTTVKHPKATEKDNPIPSSPNLFQSSEESNTKCEDSQLIEVQTQESVYVHCEPNNDFNTEQNNFSISMQEASESEDPFGETIATLDETVVIKLDPSCVAGYSQNKTDENPQVPLVMPEKSTSVVAVNLDSIDLEIAVSSGSQKVSEESTFVAVNLDSNEVADKTAQNIVDSEETIALKKLLLSCPSVSEKILETTNNQKQELCSTEPLSNPSNETSNIVDGIASTLEQAETSNKEKENSVIRSQSKEPDPNGVAVDSSETVQTQNKTLPEYNLTSAHKTVPNKKNTKKNEENLKKYLGTSVSEQAMKDVKVVVNRDFSKVTPNHETVSNKNTKKNTENIETNLDSSLSAQPIKDLKVVVKREIFSQSFSQYDDDVQIIEIPQSEAMVIDDEETAPELLEALLCSSRNPKRPPMTIVHTNISNAPSPSIYLDNFLQAQRFPSNFDITQSQSNLSQSVNVSENASSAKVFSQNVNKSVRSVGANKTSDKVCDSTDNHKFKTPDKPATNLSCFANVVLKKSPSMVEEEATGSKSGEKSSKPKENLVSNKPSSSSKSKDDSQLSKNMSQMSYVSIAPQNIPSEIEFTQTSLIKVSNQKQKERLETLASSEEGAKCIEDAKKVSFQSQVSKQKNKTSENTLESGLSMVVCLSESFDEYNKTSMNLEKSKNIEEKIKSEQLLKLNKIFDLSSPSPEQSRDKNKPGIGLSFLDILEATKELKFLFDELSAIDEEDAEKQPDATIETHSLDGSSDVELLEESIEEDFGVALTVEISSNNNKMENNKEHNREDDISNPSRDNAQKQAEVSGDYDLFSKGSVSSSDVIGMEVLKDKELSIEIKNEEQLEHIDLEDNECNVAGNANSSVDVVLSLNDSSDVELIEESEEDNDISVDGAASLSQDSSINENQNKSMRNIEGENTQVASKLKNNIIEEGRFRTEQTVGKNLYPKEQTPTNAPIYHVFVSDTNTFELINSNEVEVETNKEADVQLDDDNNIEASVKACKIRISKVNVLKTADKNSNIDGLIAQSPVEFQTNLKESERAANSQQKHSNIGGLIAQKSPKGVQTNPQETLKSVKAYEGVIFQAKENCQDFNTVACPEQSNLVIQSLIDVNFNEKQSIIEKNQLKYAKYNDFDTIENSTAHNLDGKSCREEQSFTGSTKSNSKDSSKDIQISKETAKNRSSKVPENVSLTISPSLKSQNSGKTTLTPGNISPSDFEDNDLQPEAEKCPTKQNIESVKSNDQSNIIGKYVLDTQTGDHAKSSDYNEDLSTRSPVSGEHKTHVHTLPAKILKDKTIISENSKDTAVDEYILPDSSETFAGPSQATINSEVGIQHVVLKSTDEIVEAAKNTSDNETYSETFGKGGNTSAIAIATSTQLSEYKEKDNQNSIVAEISTSVESIDLSCCYLSSDDDSSNKNDGNKKEDKSSHTVDFRSTLKSNSKISSELLQISEETSKNRDSKVLEDVEMAPIESQNLGSTTVATDHSYANDSHDDEDNDIQLATEESLTNQKTDSNKSSTLDANSKDISQQNVVDVAVIPSDIQVCNEAQNVSDGGTYSQSFEKTDKLLQQAITTSTQVELPVCDEKMNDEEYNTAGDTSESSSVELIDLYYISSDDDNNYNNNDDNNKETKFSLTKNFTELSISKKNIADTSVGLNEELLDNFTEGILPVDINSTQSRPTSIPKDSKDLRTTLGSKIILNTQENESSTNAQAASCEKKSSNDSPVAELFDERRLETTRKPSQDPVNRVMGDKENTSKDIQSKNSQNKENLKLTNSSHEFNENITPDLNIGCVLHEYNSQPSLNTPLIDEQLSNQSISPLKRNKCNLTKQSKNMQEAIEQVMKIKKNLNRIVRRRSTFDEQQHQQTVSNSSRMTYSFSQPPETHCLEEEPQKSSKFDRKRFPHLKIKTFNDLTVPLIHLPIAEVNDPEVHDPEVRQNSPKSVNSQRLSQEPAKETTTENRSNNSEPTISTILKTITLQGYIPIATLQKILNSNGNLVQVPIMIRKPLNSLPLMTAISELIRKIPNQRLDDFGVRVELKLDEQEPSPEHAQDPNPISRVEPKSEITCDKKETKSVGSTGQENADHKIPPQIIPVQLGCKTNTKIPTISKKKTTPKKSSKLPDFVQQKTHAFPSIPLKPCSKPSKNKPSRLLTVEECDYLIEDASQPIAATTTDASQILGTDCTYFENSELLRNLDEISKPPHHPEVPKEQIEQLPPRVPSSSSSSLSPPPPAVSKVIHLIPITLSEGVTARKVWQVNLKWKSQKDMSIEVRFSVNKRSMTVCDESAKLLFTFTPQIWSDVHRVLREIDHFEYKRITLRNQRKTSSLHKVLRQLFNSSSQVVDVKLINDHYNPYTICEKTIPVYRKPFQCLTKGIAPDILSKMSFLKQNLQNNNQI